MAGSKLRLVWSPQAEADLINIWRWGAKRFSPDRADAHLRDIERAARLLTETPFAGRNRDDIRVGLRSVVVHPTVAFYRVGADSVDIVRVIDGRRNLAAIFPRKTEDR
jgi:toxin ParE1/3/4